MDDKKRALWCGNWTQPFDGGGRTTGSLAEAIFDDQIVQVLCNPHAKAFYVRKSTQQGSEWDLWQKTEGYSEMESSSLVALNHPGSVYCLVHVAVMGDYVMWRTTSDTIVWSKWTAIPGARSNTPIAMVLFQSKAWVYFVHTNKKFCYTYTENGETWTKVEEIKSAPAVGVINDTKKLILQVSQFSQGLIMNVVFGDRIYVSPSLEGRNFLNWHAGTGQETNRPVETRTFQSTVYQARVGFDDMISMRSSLNMELTKWSPWTNAGFKTGSAVSMVVYNSKLVQTVHGIDSEVYVRYTEDGKYWTKWSICGDERRKTKSALTQIIYRNVLYQTMLSLDDFALTRRITSKEDAQARFQVDDTIVASSAKRDELFFSKLFGSFTFARLKSIGSDAPVVAKVLTDNKHLTSLDMGKSNVGNEGAVALCLALARHPALTSLSLAGNQINGPLEALQPLLTGCKTLKTLNLSKNRLGDDGAKSLFLILELSTSLQSLDVSDNGIERPGAQSFGEVLLKTKTLRSVFFSKNAIFNDGCQSIASSLERNKTLTSLELSDSSVSLEGSRAIAKMLLENSTLSRLVFCNQNLKRTEGTRPIAEALQENTTLTELDLSDNHIGSEGASLLIDSLAVNKVLMKLTLAGNDIEDEGLLGIAKALKVNRGLREMSLENNDFRRIGVTALASALSHNSQITLLNLSRCAVSLDGLKALSTVLRAANSIKELRLAHCRLGNAEAEELAVALKSSQTLQILDLDHNMFGTDGMLSLCALVASNPRIRSLSLFGNLLQGLTAKEFATALKSNTYLKVLRIHISAYDSEMEDLTGSLRTKQNLTDLHLNGKFSVENLRVLAAMLATNTYIQALSIIHASMTDDGVLALASFLKTNTAVSSLNLAKNSFETKGVTAICEALATNTTLSTLDLSENRIGYDSVPILADALRKYKFLTNLIVDDEYTDQLDIVYTPDLKKSTS
jgi:Ran GTPase-activating protein (RanGAP) involved in mRNA processing and transport